MKKIIQLNWNWTVHSQPMIIRPIHQYFPVNYNWDSPQNWQIDASGQFMLGLALNNNSNSFPAFFAPIRGEWFRRHKKFHSSMNCRPNAWNWVYFWNNFIWNMATHRRKCHSSNWLIEFEAKLKMKEWRAAKNVRRRKKQGWNRTTRKCSKMTMFIII